MNRLILLPRAEVDVFEAAVWYENERAGLGRDFEADLDRLLTHIQSGPHQFPELAEGARRAMLQKFPYGVYYLVEEKRCVVFAVLHLHRHPDRWKNRKQRR